MKSIIKLFPLLTVILFLLFNCTFKKGIGDYINKEALYVSTGGNDGNDGTLYTPVRTIGEGLKRLRQEGYKTLKVSKGVYYELAPIVIDASITIDGGWNEDFSGKTSLLEESDYSIISGNNTLLNLITISNARDVELKGLLLSDTVQGPTMPFDDSSIVIRNSEEIRLNSLIFQNNVANRGGALYIDTCRRVYIDRTAFVNNRAEDAGGAVVVHNSHFLYFTNNSFQNNYAKMRGGALFSNISSRVYFDKEEFIGNSSETTGGGLSFYGSSNIRVADSSLQDNRSLAASGTGGAIEVTEARDFTFRNNRFLENRASKGGDISLVLIDANLTRVIRANKFNYSSSSSIFVETAVSGGMNRFVIENNDFTLLDSSLVTAYAFEEGSLSGNDLKLHIFSFNKFRNYLNKNVYYDFSGPSTINSNATVNGGSLTGATAENNEVIN